MKTIQKWIEEQGEVLILRSYWSNEETFLYSDPKLLLNDLIKGEVLFGYIYVLKNYNLPIRGIVDDAFIEKALELLEEKIDCVLLKSEVDGVYQPVWRSDTPEDLLEDIEDYRGQKCVFGKFHEQSYTGESPVQLECRLSSMVKRDEPSKWASFWSFFKFRRR